MAALLQGPGVPPQRPGQPSGWNPRCRLPGRAMPSLPGRQALSGPFAWGGKPCQADVLSLALHVT
eukprot:scaffold530702_cov37-Prasinocladus_malaysianus.AAC.1